MHIHACVCVCMISHVYEQSNYTGYYQIIIMLQFVPGAGAVPPARSPSHFHQPTRVSHQPNKQPTVCSPESSKWERKRVVTDILHEESKFPPPLNKMLIVDN